MRYLRLLCTWLAALAIATSAAATSNARASACDGSLVYTVLKLLPSGKSFCSSLLYSTGGATQTKTSTVVVTSGCASATKTTIVHETTTDYVQSTTLLPQIKITEYASTVLIAAGPYPSINKRTANAEAAADAAAIPTPAALVSCALGALSSGCSSLVPPVTTTSKLTITTNSKCTSTVTVTSTGATHKTRTTYAFSVYPPPIIISKSTTLTTTVPAACAGPVYDSGGIVGDDNGVYPQSYPRFAQTGVECCLFCFQTPNCVASAFIDSALDCQLLIRTSGSSPGVSEQCPLGVEDYPFGTVNAGNIYPGPCGM